MEPIVPPDSLTRDPATVAGPAEGPGNAARDAARAGLYVHVPFCTTRCTYCDFATDTFSRARLERYLDGLDAEFARRAPDADGMRFTSVFFGGGTPSTLASRHFRRVWKGLRDHFAIDAGAEITLEANPETVREPLLEAWADCGVNRLSMGVQSFDPAELRTLGRIHDALRPGEAVARARAHGFRRLSLDLMFGFPGHTGECWARTLDSALALDPEHLSAYCFIPERGTPLGNAVLDGRIPLPTPEAQADHYEQLHAAVEAVGYAAYETSNFCRPGGEARHNLVYWLCRPYLGLGPSAHGFARGARYGNTRDLMPWAAALAAGDSLEDEVERPNSATAALELLMLGLRLCSGVHERDYPASLWASVRERHGHALEAAVATGRLERTTAGWRIPRSLRFVADDVIAWIAAVEPVAPRARI